MPPVKLICASGALLLACGASPSSPVSPAPSPAMTSPPGSVAPAHAPSPSAARFPIVELRQYTTNPGQRDNLIALFEREFLESQDAAGMTVFGELRDLDRPDRFVWFRGFPDMPARAAALQAFYFGPVWKAHRDAANATIADSDNVLLLHAAAPIGGFSRLAERPAPGATAEPAGFIVATIFPVVPGHDVAPLFASRIAPEVTAAGADVVGAFATEASPNNFPRLPVREGEHVFVWVERYADAAAHERALARLAASPRWHEVSAALSAELTGPPEVLRLAPAARSRLR